MTPKQEAALIALVAEMAGEYIQKLFERAAGIESADVRRDMRREASRLRGLLSEIGETGS